jgi:hypothetical protein
MRRTVMKRSIWLLALVVSLGTAAFIACGTTQSPTAPSIGPSSGGGVGPSPGGGVGPGPGGGVGPGGGGGVGPGPGGGVGPGSGGGGVGPTPGPTPTPGPSPTPGPTPTPSPIPCGGVHTFTNTVPALLGGGGASSDINVDVFTSPCRVTHVEVTAKMTAGDFASISDHGFTARLFLGGVADAAVIAVPAGILVGPQIGTGCTTLTFRDSAAAFTTASPPYDGTFAPAGQFDGVAPPSGFENVSPNGTWELALYFSSTSAPPGTLVSVDCWSVQLTVAP